MVVLFTPTTGQAGLPYLDKAVHLVLFLCLTLVAIIHFGWKRLIRVIIGISIYIVVAEVIQQLFIPGRDAELLDILAGFLGVTIAIFLWKNNKKLII